MGKEKQLSRVVGEKVLTKRTKIFTWKRLCANLDSGTEAKSQKKGRNVWAKTEKVNDRR